MNSLRQIGIGKSHYVHGTLTDTFTRYATKTELEMHHFRKGTKKIKLLEMT